jgi:hypothetical protein
MIPWIDMQEVDQSILFYTKDVRGVYGKVGFVRIIAKNFGFIGTSVKQSIIDKYKCSFKTWF